MEAFAVRTSGPMTTVQDLGRRGFLDRGVPLSGALDPFACRAANLLVGNAETEAVLEFTLMGPTLEILSAADIALTGADMGMTVNGGAVPGWRAVRVSPGDIVRIPRAVAGCRAYLAVTGGIDVPPVMGSRSTFVRARIGGVQGRGLVKGDVLRRGERKLSGDLRSFPDAWIPRYAREISLRAIPGPQDDSFRQGSAVFFSAVYEVTTEADRMGYRLRGPAVECDEGVPKSIVTEPTTPGNVQIPADGQPIILLVEQTSGGYAKIATVISPDLSRVAQALPGNTVRFERITVEDAHRLYREQQDLLSRIRQFLQ
ncbi:MAG TPA: biotin-dependent carboxyltransferase family protein [Syntrophales bacterium]|mgnify:CR=1 FL=1|nr:biotin-dependent carboxyltransferase family protein [Syntrophales bacterium]